MSTPIGKRVLGARKAAVTKTITKCTSLLADPNIDYVTLEAQIKLLIKHQASHEETFTKFLQKMEDEQDDEENYVREVTEFADQQESVEQKIAEFQHRLNQRHGSHPVLTPSGTPGANLPFQAGNPAAGSLGIGQHVMKLPQLTLREFEGTDFPEFADNFKSLVHNRTDLDDLTKLNYLKSMVKGEPHDLIKGFENVGTSYQHAYELLEENYGDKNRMRLTHCVKLGNLPSPAHNYQDLQTFRIAMDNSLRTLSTSHDITASDWFISAILQDKLHPKTREVLNLKMNKNYFSCEELSKGLREIVSCMQSNQRLARPVKTENKQSNPSKGINPVSDDVTRIGAYAVREKPSKGNKPKGRTRRCILCGDPHWTSECTRYVTVDDRKKRAQVLKLCSRCLGNHSFRECRSKNGWCFHCKQKDHLTVFCKMGASRASTVTTSSPAGVDASESGQVTEIKATVALCSINQAGGKVEGGSGGGRQSTALPVAQLTLKNLSNYLTVNILFDQGSQRSFIKQDVLQQLQIKPHTKVPLNIAGFLNASGVQMFDLAMINIALGTGIKVVEAVVVEKIPDKIHIPGLCHAIETLKKADVKLICPDTNTDNIGYISMIIGGDYYSDFVDGMTHKGNISLLSTAGGHMIHGRIPFSEDRVVSHMTEDLVGVTLVARITASHVPFQKAKLLEEGCEEVHKLWNLDAIGIDENLPSPCETQAYQHYTDTVTFEGGQYWVRLPWKVDRPHLPTNYRMAYGQMKAQIQELQKTPELLLLYDKILQEQLNNGFIEEVADSHPVSGTHYIPHHGVKKDSTTTPLRIVYNCSAKDKQGAVSLNDCLMTGPSLTQKLGDMLTTFRTNSYAYTADISKAFLRVGLQEVDRDYTRFLWPTNPQEPTSSVRTYRFKSVLFGATSSPFLLEATLTTHLQNEESPLRETLLKGFYVDNLLGSLENEKDLVPLYEAANAAMNRGNLPLRMWNSNSNLLRMVIQENDPASVLPRYENVLGLTWDTENDSLCIKPTNYKPVDKLTKRSLLSEVSRCFDPLGLISPVSIRGRMLLQEAWKLQGPWDDELPPTLNQKWRDLSTEFSQLHTIKFPRVVACEGRQYILHVFCDASVSAYGAVAYLVTQQDSLLITSKARVTPLKVKTIPRLELTALHVGTKLAVYLNKVLSHLTLTRTVIWGDNEAVLQWVRNNNSKLVYVQNRVAEIREMQTDFQFRHVPTKENPADMLSRGILLKDMSSSLWHHGPSWLTKEKDWPLQKPNIMPEITVCLNTVEMKPLAIDGTRFSSLDKLLRVTTLVFNYLKLNKINYDFPEPLHYWIKRVQEETFSYEYNSLEEHNTSVKKPNLIHNLGLYLDTRKLIRCRGRIQNSSLPKETIHPLLLPKDHWLTSLIINRAHITVLHGGVQDTLCHLRQSYWIPQGRQSVKKQLRKCVTCLHIEGKACVYPGPPPLPADRVRHVTPFEVTGVDYSGPIILTKTADKNPIKVYVCLFTCATTRAIHLEVATDMTAEIFIKLFRRFAARRSCPRLIISDNGTNFVAGAAYIQKIFDQPEVQQMLTHRRCQWKTIPPRAPWQGGFYERMVGIVKRCLRKTLHRQKIDLEEFRTVVTEVENKINNRPLTYVTDSLDNIDVLSPSHLIYGRRLEPVPPMLDEDIIEDRTYLEPDHLRRKFKYLNRVIERWEKVWHTEYLTSLRERFYGAGNPVNKNHLQPGDVVIIDNDNPRSQWPLGKIVSLNTDTDGIVRTAHVLHKGTVSKRTLDKLVPLEIHSDDPKHDATADVSPPRAHLKRRAAEVASQRIKKLIAT